MRRTLIALTLATTVVAAGATALVGPAGPATAASCPNGYVALTYDDGPNPASTTQLLAALKNSGVRATFFVLGQRIQENPDLLRAEAAAGMWIGNHTWDHNDLGGATQAAMLDELTRTQAIVASTVGQTPRLFRPPYGNTNATLKSVEASLGLTEVLWTQDPQDYNGVPTATIVNTAAQMTAGSIMLMHDAGYPNTIAAVPQIVSDLTARGLCAGMIDPATGKVVAPDGGSGGTTTTTTRPTTTTTSRTTTTTTTTRTTSTTTSTSTTTPTTGGGSGSCTVSTATNQWTGGFVQNVTVKSAATTTGWTVTIGLPSGSSVTNAWSATLTGSTGTVTATNVGYNANASGAGANFGFQGNGTATGMTFSCAAR